MKQLAIGAVLIAMAAAAWFFFNGGVSHWRIEKRISQEATVINRKVDFVNARLEAMDAKLDRIEGKLDRILELADRPLPDGMR